MNDNFVNDTKTDEIDFSFYVSVILKRIWLLIGVVFICVVGAVAVTVGAVRPTAIGKPVIIRHPVSSELTMPFKALLVFVFKIKFSYSFCLCYFTLGRLL